MSYGTPWFCSRERADKVFPIPYQQREVDAIAFRNAHGITPKDKDTVKVALLAIDNQITFCLPPPWGQLFVGGRSGTAAVDDTYRLCDFIYRNLGTITKIIPTMDTHYPHQIFHAAFWVDGDGNHPDGAMCPFITVEDVESGKWMPNPALSRKLAYGDHAWLYDYAKHYVKTLSSNGKFQLQVWPYHAMKGSVSHALVPLFEEAVFFHEIARSYDVEFPIKGEITKTENYSVFKPEVEVCQEGWRLTSTKQDQDAQEMVSMLMRCDMVIAAGQAKSHCFAWTMDNFLEEIIKWNPDFAKKVYILEDCTSPVVIPGVVDFTEVADAAMERLVKGGMNLVKSVDDIRSWTNSPVK